MSPEAFSPSPPFLDLANIGPSPGRGRYSKHLICPLTDNTNLNNTPSFSPIPSPQATISESAVQEIKEVMQDFLRGCNYECPHTPKDTELRQRTAQEVAVWDVGLPSQHAEKIVDTSCHLAETAYGHLPLEHRFFVARYTAYFIYADDLPEQCQDALLEFSRRFTNGERQLNSVLDRLAVMVKGSHQLWTDVGANAIITGTLDSLTASYIESTTRKMIVKPGAVRYPEYLRLKTGIDPPFIAFIFERGWRDTAESYVQVLPEMEYWIGAANDVLSFYKEKLAHETNNYIQIRAASEQTSGIAILRKLAAEVLDTLRRIERLTADDAELSALWRGYAQVREPRLVVFDIGNGSEVDVLCLAALPRVPCEGIEVPPCGVGARGWMKTTVDWLPIYGK